MVGVYAELGQRFSGFRMTVVVRRISSDLLLCFSVFFSFLRGIARRWQRESIPLSFLPSSLQMCPLTSCREDLPSLRSRRLILCISLMLLNSEGNKHIRCQITHKNFSNEPRIKVVPHSHLSYLYEDDTNSLQELPIKRHKKHKH